jgi:drug/metabolite transporter (DMT)-like permease
MTSEPEMSATIAQEPAPLSMAAPGAMSASSLVGIILVCAIWGAGFSFMKVALRYLPPFLFVGIRFTLTAVGVAVYMRLLGISWRVPRAMVWPMAALIGLLFVQQAAIFFGLTRTTAGRMGVILNTQPIITAVMAHWFVAHDRLTPGKIIGLAMAIFGVFFMFRESFTHFDRHMLIGDLLALLAALNWGVQNIFTKHTVRHVAPAAITAWQSLLSAPLFFLTSLIAEPGPWVKQPLDATFLWATAYIIVIATIFGFVVWVYLFEHNSPSRLTSFCFVTPIASVAFGRLILGEAISRDIVTAMALVGLGIFLANYQRQPRGRERDFVQEIP